MNWVTAFFPHWITCSLARTLRWLTFCCFWELHYRTYLGYEEWGVRESLEERWLLEWWLNDLLWKCQLEEGLSLHSEPGPSGHLLLQIEAIHGHEKGHEKQSANTSGRTTERVIFLISRVHSKKGTPAPRLLGTKTPSSPGSWERPNGSKRFTNPNNTIL